MRLSNLDPAFRPHLHPVARPGDVTEHPTRVELLGEAVALVRPTPDGEIVAFPDRCPHRYARLSDGCVVDGELQCPYHGWRYRPDGSCSLIPAAGPDSSAAALVQLDRLAVVEAFGLVFVALEGDGSALLDVAEWDLPGLTPAWLPKAVTRAGAGQFVDNFLDIAHFPFVHAGTFGAAEDERIGDLDITKGDGTLQVRYQHVVEHHEDPGVATGERPLLQPRVMEYTYRVPFGMRLRLEYPMAGIENTIVGWAVPEAADRTALWFVLLRNDLSTDEQAKAAVTYELSVLDEDLRILDHLPEPELELELTAQPHTKADRPTVELRRLLRDLIGRA
jgi:phenylpropionate dioxygenase-like ring-hydroxylating dioxygenase large terminal subunit